MEDKKVYVISDIQEILGISRSKAYQYIGEIYKSKDKPFRVLKIGTDYRIPKKSFDSWLDGDE